MAAKLNEMVLIRTQFPSCFGTSIDIRTQPPTWQCPTDIRSPFVLLVETCRCPEHVFANYWSHSPYVKTLTTGFHGGIFPAIVRDMVRVACGVCANGHGPSSLVMAADGGTSYVKKSFPDVLEDIDDSPKISFPIFGNKYLTSYLDSYAYVHLVDSPGVVFLTAEVELDVQADAFGVPYSLLLLLLCMLFIVGFTIWVLVGD